VMRAGRTRSTVRISGSGQVLASVVSARMSAVWPQVRSQRLRRMCAARFNSEVCTPSPRTPN
jgi:hypothetical protein